MTTDLDLNKKDLMVIRQVLGTRLRYIMDSMEAEIAKHPDVTHRKWWTDRVAHRSRLEAVIPKVNYLLQQEREKEVPDA